MINKGPVWSLICWAENQTKIPVVGKTQLEVQIMSLPELYKAGHRKVLFGVSNLSWSPKINLLNQYFSLHSQNLIGRDYPLTGNPPLV